MKFIFKIIFKVLFKVYVKILIMLLTCTFKNNFLTDFNRRTNWKKWGLSYSHMWICLYTIFLAKKDKETFSQHSLSSYADCIKTIQSKTENIRNKKYINKIQDHLITWVFFRRLQDPLQRSVQMASTHWSPPGPHHFKTRLTHSSIIWIPTLFCILFP